MMSDMQEKIIYFFTCTETQDEALAFQYLSENEFNEEKAVVAFLEKDKEISLFSKKKPIEPEMDEASRKVIEQILREEVQQAEMPSELPSKPKKAGFLDKAANLFKKKLVDYDDFKINCLFPGEKTTFEFLTFLSECESKLGLCILYDTATHPKISKTVETLHWSNKALLEKFTVFECHHKSKSGLTLTKILGKQSVFPCLLVISPTGEPLRKENIHSVITKDISPQSVENKLKYISGEMQENNGDGFGFDYDEKGHISGNVHKDFSIEPATNFTTILLKGNKTEKERKFAVNDTLEDLYDFVSQYKLGSKSCKLRQAYPPKILQRENTSLKEAGLVPNAVVIIEE